MVVHVRRFAIFIGGVLCTLPVLAAHAAPIKANTPAAVALASATRHADILIFPKGKAGVSIPFTLVDGVPVTSAVRINGKFAGRFIIDTGAQETFISRALANHCHLPVALQLHITCKRCRVEVRRVVRLQVGSITLADDSIDTAGLAKVKNSMVKAIVGSIGGDILGQMPFSVDYRDSMVIFYNPKSFHAPQKAAAFPIEIFGDTAKTKDGILASRLFTRMGVPTLAGTLNGKPVRWCPDTGTTVAVTLMPMFVHEHPELVNWQCFLMNTRNFQLRGQAFGTKHTSISILGEEINNVGHPYAIAAKPWQLKRENFSGPQVLIGGRFLRNYRLTFDYAAKKMWVQRNPPLSYQAQLADGLNPNQSDPIGETPLMHAAFQGDLAGVTALLRAGADPLARDKSGLTVLDYAAMGGNSQIIKLLLAGAAKKEVNDGGAVWTPLTCAAAQLNDRAALRDLVQAGAMVSPGSSEAFTPLLAAVQYDNMAAIGWLIQHGANVNGTDRDQQTPLWVSVETGNLKAFRLLRHHGAVLYKKGPYGSSPLCAAAIGGHVAMIKFLLSRSGGGFPVNGPNSVGETPLMLAAVKGQLPAAEILVKSGARINLAAPGVYNQTALMFAALHEQPNMLKLLIRHGAEVNAQNSLGETPLTIATAKVNVSDAMALLKAGANANAPTSNGRSVLEVGATSGCGKIVKVLLAHGATANAVDDSGGTPLMAAADKNGPAAVLALIRAGADVNATAAGGSDALDYAAEAGKADVVGILLRHGAKVNAADFQGITPLMAASAHGQAPVVRALIQAGATVGARAQGVNGWDALEFAAERGNPSVVTLLVQHGAKVNAADRLGHTPLMIAVAHGNLRAALALIKAGANIHTKSLSSHLGIVALAVSRNHPKMIPMLISHGAKVDQRYALRRTPLILAASKGFLACVQALLKAGANVNAQDDNGYTPLEAAASDGQLKVAKVIIRAGANVNLADHYGMTPLDYACLAKHPSAMVALLLKAGANPKLKDKMGRNAIYYARKSGSAKAVALVQAAISQTIAPPASRKQATQ